MCGYICLCLSIIMSIEIQMPLHADGRLTIGSDVGTHLPPCLTQGLFLVADHYEHQASWSQGSKDSWLCLLSHLRSSGVMDSPQKHWAFGFFPTFIFTWVLGIKVKCKVMPVFVFCKHLTHLPVPHLVFKISVIIKSHHNSKALFCKTTLSIVS